MGFKKTLPAKQIMVTSQTMSGTSTIYSDVINATNLDNLGLEISWTGTPTGTITILAAIYNKGEPNGYSPTNPISGNNSLTFNPVLAQPAGSASGYLISLNQFPYYFYQVKYVNASGSGLLTVYAGGKDLN